jgi:hypothetical protein
MRMARKVTQAQWCARQKGQEASCVTPYAQTAFFGDPAGDFVAVCLGCQIKDVARLIGDLFVFDVIAVAWKEFFDVLTAEWASAWMMECGHVGDIIQYFGESSYFLYFSHCKVNRKALEPRIYKVSSPLLLLILQFDMI